MDIISYRISKLEFLMLNKAKTPKGSAKLTPKGSTKLNAGIATKWTEAKPTSGELRCHPPLSRGFSTKCSANLEELNAVKRLIELNTN